MPERPNPKANLDPLSEGEVDFSEYEGLSERKGKVIIRESAPVYIRRQIRELGYLELDHRDLSNSFYIGEQITCLKPRRLFKPKVVTETYKLCSLHYRDQDQGRWTLSVFGRENLDRMEELANVIALDRGVDMEIILHSEKPERWRGKLLNQL